MPREYDKVLAVAIALSSLLLDKKAINCYEKALKMHSSYGNALKYKGFALFNLGIGNGSMSIRLNTASPYDSPCAYAGELIDYYNNSHYRSTETSRAYLESSYQYLKDASYSH